MACKKNMLINDLASSKLLTGLWCSLTSATAVEVLSTVPYDWFLLDMEHAPNSLGDIVDQLRVLDSSTVSAVVRPPSSDTITIKRLLDAGVKNLLFPYVQTIDQAREIIRATRYAPDGIRGVSISGRAALYGAKQDYLNNAADELVIGLQLETRQALDALSSFAALDEVGILFFGPADLSADMGLLGQPDHPDVRGMITNAIKSTVKHNKVAGVLAPNIEAAQAYIAAGARFVAIGNDLACLRLHAQRLLDDLSGSTK